MPTSVVIAVVFAVTLAVGWLYSVEMKCRIHS